MVGNYKYRDIGHIVAAKFNPLRAESESLYDWRFTANQFVLAPGLLRLTTRGCC
jgi:hypothetical protein